MSKQLPSRPNLDHLRDQAKELLFAFRLNDPDAVRRFEANLPGLQRAAVALHDAQSVIAREYGLVSWPKLVAHVEEIRAREGITPEIEIRYLEAAMSDAPDRIRRLIELYPGLPRYSNVCALVSAEVDLVRSIDVNERIGTPGYMPIEYVAYSRIHLALPERAAAQEECARILLEKGADPNTSHPFGPQAWPLPVLFGAAAESGHAGVVRVLLSFGANPNDDESVYHSAENARINILEVLEEGGAVFGPPYEPLGFLMYYNETFGGWEKNLIGARWLLERGATPNLVRGELKETPLHVAARAAVKSDLIELLLDHGANPQAEDANGNTPFQVAYAAGNQHALAVFEKRGLSETPNPATTLLAACSANDERAIAQSLANDPQLLHRLQAQALELMVFFAQSGKAESLRGLLFAGFLPSGENTTTPLHFACLEGQLEAVQVLVERGAPMDIRDGEHHATPLGWATFGSEFHASRGRPYPEIVRYLVAAGSPLEDAINQADTTKYTERRPEILVALQEAIALRQQAI